MKQSWFSKNILRWTVIYIGIWVVLGVLSAVEVYIGQLLWDKPITWAVAFRRSFKEVFAYAICMLGVLWLCRRVSFEPGRRVRWFLVHMLGALVFSVSLVGFVSWLESGERSVQTGEILTFEYIFNKLLVSYSLSLIFKYWIVVFGCLGWHYYKAYRERERQAAVLATELVQARLHALRMQINPHFLFNTLNTISSLVHENPEAADRMIVRLSELLRRTLDHGENQEVELREEIRFLKSYLEIEQMRFPDRLSVTFDIDARADQLLVPHLILQPLVENALHHGLLNREEGGRIEVTARVVDNQRLELRVRDNGFGLPPQEVAQAREGIGLKNVRSRLAALYGNEHTFELRNAEGGGVEAYISIPCRTISQQPASASFADVEREHKESRHNTNALRPQNPAEPA